MAKGVIEFTLKLKNPNALQKHLENVTQGVVAKHLQKKCDEFVSKLVVEEGAYVAGWAFNGTPVEITVEKIPKGYKLVANGEAVGFLEFGAGVLADTGHHFAKNAPFDVYPGSWSKDHAKQFYMNQEWTYGRVTTDRVAPRRGLYKAYRQMYITMEQVAREVFNTL